MIGTSEVRASNPPQQSTLTEPDETEIDRLFPLEDVSPPSMVKDETPEEIEARIQRVQRAVAYIPPVPNSSGRDEANQEDVRRLGDFHQIFERPSDLHGLAKRFYEVVADMSGLTLQDLVQAVYRMEKMTIRWEKDEKHRLREMDVE